MIKLKNIEHDKFFITFALKLGIMFIKKPFLFAILLVYLLVECKKPNLPNNPTDSVTPVDANALKNCLNAWHEVLVVAFNGGQISQFNHAQPSTRIALLYPGVDLPAYLASSTKDVIDVDNSFVGFTENYDFSQFDISSSSNLLQVELAPATAFWEKQTIKLTPKGVGSFLLILKEKEGKRCYTLPVDIKNPVLTFEHFYDVPRLAKTSPATFKHTVAKCRGDLNGPEHINIYFAFQYPHGNSFTLNNMSHTITPPDAMTNKGTYAGMWRYNKAFCVKGNTVEIKYWFNDNPALYYTANIEIVD
jgi:hypothetical protein